MSGAKTFFGRALASVRASRGMTAVDLALDLDVHANVVSAIETGKRAVDGRLVADIDAALNLSIEERRRLAAGLAASSHAGDLVRYDLRPRLLEAHVTSAFLAVFTDEIGEAAWLEIGSIVQREIGLKAARAARAARTARAAA